MCCGVSICCLIGSLSEDFLSDTRQAEVGTSFLGSGFAQILGQIDYVRVRQLVIPFCLRQDILKGKTYHFLLTCFSQKRLCPICLILSTIPCLALGSGIVHADNPTRMREPMKTNLKKVVLVLDHVMQKS